jgi:dTDP-4-amino-4,6-dideoxygalactose transaminase
MGDLGAFSFQASKNITAGEGGMAITNDPELYERCWSLHNVGRSRGGAWYQHDLLGWNFRMTEWAAAILLVQLERLPAQTKTREENARYLAEALSEVPGLSPLPEDPRGTQNSRHFFILRYDPAAFGGHSRDDFVAALRAEGITPCSPGYQPSLIESPALQRTMTAMFGPDSAPQLSDYPVTKRAVYEAVWLFQTTLVGGRSDIDSIVEAAQKIQRAWG